MNKAILAGRLTKDPEVRYTQSGKVVCTFTLAVDRNNEKKEADFIPIVAWGKVAEVIGNNLTKGRKVLVDGRMQVRNYEDNSGQKRYVTEVIAHAVQFLDSPKEQKAPDGYSGPAYGPEVFPDDDVPF